MNRMPELRESAGCAPPWQAPIGAILYRRRHPDSIRKARLQTRAWRLQLQGRFFASEVACDEQLAFSDVLCGNCCADMFSDLFVRQEVCAWQLNSLFEADISIQCILRFAYSEPMRCLQLVDKISHVTPCELRQSPTFTKTALNEAAASRRHTDFLPVVISDIGPSSFVSLGNRQ